MFIVPTIPHLRDVELKIEYQELQEPQTLSELGQPHNLEKWRDDPDIVPGQISKPEPKFYVNGEMVRQGGEATRILKNAPPPDRFPRRNGISRVLEHEPDYEETCRKQKYLCNGAPNTSPMTAISNDAHTNGITPPRSDQSKSVNGGSPIRSTASDTQMVNGLPHGITNGGSPPLPPAG